MNSEIKPCFFEDLENLNRGKNFKFDIMQRIILLEYLEGWIPSDSKRLKNHSPLIELRYRDTRIFYVIKNGVILIVGILKKDVKKFSSEVLKNMRKRGL